MVIVMPYKCQFHAAPSHSLDSGSRPDMRHSISMKIKLSLILLLAFSSRLQARPVLNEEYLLGRAWVGDAESITFNQDGTFLAQGPFGQLGSGAFEIHSDVVFLTASPDLRLWEPFRKHGTLECRIAEDSRHRLFTVFLVCNLAQVRFGADDSEPAVGSIRYWGSTPIVVLDGDTHSETEITLIGTALFREDPSAKSKIVFKRKLLKNQKSVVGFIDYQSYEKDSVHGLQHFWYHVCFPGEQMAGNLCGWVYGNAIRLD